MIKDPFGVSMGGSGLVAFPMDMMKFAYFIAHSGLVLGEQLLSPSYIDMAVSALTETRMTAPLPSEAQGYGFQFWRNQKNGYTCYGMGGQLIIFLPEHHLICVTTADTQSIQGGNQQIYDALYEELLPYVQQDALEYDKTAEQYLANAYEALAMKPLISAFEPKDVDNYLDKVYEVSSKDADFQNVSVHFETDSGKLEFTYKHTLYTVSFGMGTMQTGLFPIYNLWYAASGAWLFDGTLLIKAHIIDAYVGCVQFQLSFGKEELTIFMSKKEESLFQEFQGHLYCR